MALYLLWPARHNKDQVAQAVLLSRIDAASAGAEAASVQLATLDVAIAPSRYVAAAVDRARAAHAASSIARAREAETLTSSWVDRIAVTESSHAFNIGLREQTVEAVKRADVILYRVWDATLDRRTCPVCAGLDGHKVLVEESYAGGFEPGAVHAWCRCTEEITT